MVQYPTTVDRAFAALADPTRRAVLERLGAGSATISELAEPFGMSLTGMKKHIRLLEEAQLVTTEKVGRVRRCMLAPYAFEGISTWLQRLDRFAQVVERTKGDTMNTTTVTTPNELEIRVERIFDAPRAHVFSVWTDPELIPEWWGDGTVVEEMDVRPGGTYRFRTAYGVVEGEFREVDAARAARADVPEPPADARVRGSRRADEADADDALRDDRGARHDDAVRRRGRREERLRAHRRGAAAARSTRSMATRRTSPRRTPPTATI